MRVDEFIHRWTGQEGGAERANYALFLSELCDVIGVPRPDPASARTEGNDYVFERFVRRPDGSNGRIDLYKRDSFVLEARQSRQDARTATGEANDKYVPGAQPQLAVGVAPVPESLGSYPAGLPGRWLKRALPSCWCAPSPANRLLIAVSGPRGLSGSSLQEHAGVDWTPRHRR